LRPWRRQDTTTVASAQAVPKPNAPRAPNPTPIQPKAALPQTVGANELMKLTTPSGFVDDLLAFDNQRVGYVVADTSTKAELHVVQLGCAKCAEQKQEIVVDLSPVTLRPTAVRLVGQRAFVIGSTEDGNQVAALIELAKPVATPVYKLGPAPHITLVTRDNAPRVAVHKVSQTKVGTRHDVELIALETGKRVALGKPFELATDTHKKLDFKVNHWSEGWTRASGIKGGEWRKKENQRSPDTEATYDLISGKFLENKPIPDLFEQRKRFQVLADGGGSIDFLRMAWDNSAIQLWHKGQVRTVELDQPLSTYDAKSMQGLVQPDGSAWIVLKVDPVNAEAVARKKADPEYLDVFRAAGSDGKAIRKARVLAKGLRHRFGVVGDYFWLLERSMGFDRGGRSITIYSLQ
jgi:hypothetical protein